MYFPLFLVWNTQRCFDFYFLFSPALCSYSFVESQVSLIHLSSLFLSQAVELYPVKHFHVILTAHVLCNRTEAWCRCKMLCVPVYIISQFMAVGFYRDQIWCSHSMCVKLAQNIRVIFPENLFRAPVSYQLLECPLWTFLEWRVIVSPTWADAKTHEVQGLFVVIFWVRCIGFLWVGFVLFVGFWFGGWFFLRAEVVTSTESRWGTGEFLENISFEWWPWWPSLSLLSHKAATMEKISFAALW